jgi:hypothetical protein
MLDPLVEVIKVRVSQPGQRTLMEAKHGMPAKYFRPPVESVLLDAAEAALGLPLPDLVRDLYLHVGGGGFGPGYGIVGLDDGTAYNCPQLVEFTLKHRDMERILESIGDSLPGWSWQPGYIPYCDWGDAVLTIFDCNDPTLPVYWMDGVEFGRHSSQTLRQWWQDWLDGSIKQT